MSFTLDLDAGPVADLLRRADRLPALAKGRVRAVVERYANLIVRTGKGLAPVESGDLRSTIRSIVSGALERFAAAVLAGGIAGESGRLVDYADIVELGQLSNEAYPEQPYLGPAFETHRAGFLRDLRAAATPKASDL